MEKGRGNENMRREKSRERVETTRNVEKKERREQAESNEGEKVFCLWKIWTYGLQLQECGRGETDLGVLKQI